MEATRWAFAVLCATVVGCAGPGAGDGDGSGSFRDEALDVTYCEWRHEYDPPGTYRALRVYAETSLGPVSVRHAADGSDTVTFTWLGDAQTCTGTLSESAGAWAVSAECSDGTLRVTITACHMAG